MAKRGRKPIENIEGNFEVSQRETRYVFLIHGISWGFSYAPGEKAKESVLKSRLQELLNNNVIQKL